jgi:hypothetical protein
MLGQMLGQMVFGAAQRVQGYASGGLVAPSRSSALSSSLSSLPASALIGSAAAAAAGAAGASTVPLRTVRVELAVADRRVNASVDPSDEGRLLELLEAARLRAV